MEAKALKSRDGHPTRFPLPAIMNPQFDFLQTKWAEIRQEKVENICHKFMTKSNLAFVLTDSKFGNEPLMLLKKSHFEDLMKTANDLISGEVAIKHSIEGVVHSVQVLISLFESNAIHLQPPQQQMVGNAVRSVQFNMEQVRQTTKTEMFFAYPPKKRDTASLNEDEEKQFAEMIEAERKK